jgi:hypothetical protein
MAFPWELNLERPYREKRSFQEELGRRDSIDSGLGGSGTTPDGFPVDSDTRDGTATAQSRGNRTRASRGR